MKKTWDIFLLFIFIFTLGSCSFCKVKPDREVFSKMDPIEWKDEYVFSATWYPSQIQVWNSKTNKLEHTYELCTDNENWVNGKSRYIDVMCMSVINKCIWFIGWGVAKFINKVRSRNWRNEIYRFRFFSRRSCSNSRRK